MDEDLAPVLASVDQEGIEANDDVAEWPRWLTDAYGLKAPGTKEVQPKAAQSGLALPPIATQRLSV